HPDARMLQDSILSRTPGLDTRMPQRINVAFGGCAACRDHARVNDLSFVSVVTPEGELGYGGWIGCGLGKSTSMLAFKAIDFVPGAHVLAAGNALFNVHIEHSDFDQPAKGRLKFVIRRRGREEVHRLFLEEFERTKLQEWPDPQPVSTPLSSSIAAVLARAPEGGWGGGVRPQGAPGWVMVTVCVP